MNSSHLSILNENSCVNCALGTCEFTRKDFIKKCLPFYQIDNYSIVSWDNDLLYKNNLEVHCKNDTSIYLDNERIFKAQERFMNADKLKRNTINFNDEIKYTIENRMGIILKKIS